MADHYLAGGSLGVTIFFLTMFASAFSGYTIVGVTGDAYRTGYQSLMWVASMQMIFTSMVLIGPRFHRLAKIHSYVSPNEFVQHRYDSKLLRVLVSIATVVGSMFYIIGQFKAIGQSAVGVSNGSIPAVWGAVALGVVMLIYEALGGMRSVAWNDAIQGVLLVFAFLSLVGVGVVEFEGLIKLAKDLPRAMLIVPPAEEKLAFLTFAMLGLAFPCYPHIMQRVFAVQNEKKFRIGVGFMFWATFLAYIPTIATGLIGKVRHPNVSDEDSDQMFSIITSDLLEIGGFSYAIATMLVASTVAAIMSTTDSLLMGCASVIALDLIAPFRQTMFAQRTLLIISQVITVLLVGIGVVFGTLIVFDIKSLYVLQSAILLQCLPAYLLGAYWISLRYEAVLAGFIVGQVVSVTMHIFAPAPGGLNVAFFGIVANIVVLLATHFILEYLIKTVRRYKFELHEGVKGIYKDPVEHTWLLFCILILTMLSCGFFRRPGEMDEIVLGFPVWAFTNLMICFSWSFLACLVIVFVWKPKDLTSILDVDTNVTVDDEEKILLEKDP